MTIEQLSGSEGRRHSAARVDFPRLSRIFRRMAVVAAIFGFQGCGDHDAPPDTTKQAVKFDDVPENVRTAASKAIPGVKLDEAWKNLADGGKLHSYEIRGKNAANGKTREVRVSPEGEILEME